MGNKQQNRMATTKQEKKKKKKDLNFGIMGDHQDLFLVVPIEIGNDGWQ